MYVKRTVLKEVCDFPGCGKGLGDTLDDGCTCNTMYGLGCGHHLCPRHVKRRFPSDPPHVKDICFVCEQAKVAGTGRYV